MTKVTSVRPSTINGIHVVNDDTVTVETNFFNSSDEGILIETGIELPFPSLGKASDWTTVDYNSRAVTTIQIEACKGDLDSRMLGLMPVDFALSFPFINGSRLKATPAPPA